MTASAKPSDGANDLRQRWAALWEQLGVGAAGIPDVQPVLDAYEAPDRHYHTLRHIQHCLRELDQSRAQAGNAAAIELAIWFHDVIYDAQRHDNEQRSAKMMADSARTAGASPDVVDHVSAMILATKHAQVPADADTQLLLDIDLSIFGQAVEEFDAYERGIRLEYQHVASDAFRSGRLAVLRRFLERPHLYLTKPMRDRYEWPARQNLQRSIERLAAQG